MIEVALNRGVWSYDPNRQLGTTGGFGAVFLGLDQNGSPVAVKQLLLSAAEAAHRELRLADELAGRGFLHVMPILDSGQDSRSERYYVVMPVASHSLQAAIDQRGPFSIGEAADILVQIARGLAEIPKIVHRDLKPQNVLLHDGVWKIADFGIARFIAESTSANTLKDVLSPPYAAPEQWKGDAVGATTDLYALGCIAFALVTGRPPFVGAGGDLREAHLRLTPPSLDSGSHELDGLVALLLRKLPDTRPTLARTTTILEKIVRAPVSKPSETHARLVAAGAREAQRMAAEQAAMERQLDEKLRRSELRGAASEQLAALVRALIDWIAEAVPTGVKSEAGGSATFRAGGATLWIRASHPNERANGTLEPSKWDLLTEGSIGVGQSTPHYEWTASLYYMRPDADSEFRWYEVSFYRAFGDNQHVFEPFFLPASSDAAEALGPGMHSYVVAFGPTAIDAEDSDPFRQRWSSLFARALEGELQHPRMLPLSDRDFG